MKVQQKKWKCVYFIHGSCKYSVWFLFFKKKRKPHRAKGQQNLTSWLQTNRC